MHSLTIHGRFHKINVILGVYLKGIFFFILHETACTKVMVANEIEI